LMARSPRSGHPMRASVQTAFLNISRRLFVIIWDGCRLPFAVERSDIGISQPGIFTETGLDRFGDVVMTDNTLDGSHLETAAAASLRTLWPRRQKPFKLQTLRFPYQVQMKKTNTCTYGGHHFFQKNLSLKKKNPK
jgi:hypothetical protein